MENCFMKDKIILDDWFKRAKSNLLRAKSDRNSDYAQGSRYPGIQESVTEEEYKEALSLAEVIYFWARENAYRQ